MQSRKQENFPKIKYISLILLILSTLGLQLLRSDTFGTGYTYYTAAVDNMLQSPSNFFYAVADAGGVTVDKPPIALWVQTIFASAMGLHGFTIILPSIFAAILSICIVYRLVAQDFGHLTGLIAGFVLATTPISVALHRTNTVDSLMILMILFAVWVIKSSVERQKKRFLLLGMVWLGIAFNIKMLQSYLILPALYAIYLFGSSLITWRKKISHLVMATIILGIVSFSWATIVDLTPPEQRPFIGTTQSNSVMGLIFGHNALSRLIGPVRAQNLFSNTPIPSTAPTANSIEPLRLLFNQSYAKELGWLLPFGLFSVVLTALRGFRQSHFCIERRASLLWGIWLITGVGVMSFLSLFHSYYFATIVPALAACVAIGIQQLWQLFQRQQRLAIFLASVCLMITIMYQWVVLGYYEAQSIHVLLMLIISTIIYAISVSFIMRNDANDLPRMLQILGGGSFVASLLLIPTGWGIATALEIPSMVFPSAYPNTDKIRSRYTRLNLAQGDFSIIENVPFDAAVDYDLIVSNHAFGSDLIIATELRILYLGGFGGTDPIYDLEIISTMIEENRIGFVLISEQHSEILDTVAQLCIIERIIIPPSINSQTGESRGGLILYDC